MTKDIHQYCQTCIVGAQVNAGKSGKGRLSRPAPPTDPWERIQIDFMGPLPMAKGGNQYLLVIIDQLSK